MQENIWPSWSFDRRTRPAFGAWTPSTPCVIWSNPRFASQLTLAPLQHATIVSVTNLLLNRPNLCLLIQNEMSSNIYYRNSLLCLIQIRSQAQFQDLCQQHVKVEADGASRTGCCPSWSLGNYLAVLTNASRCLSLTSQQVEQQANKSLNDYYRRRLALT